MNQDDTIYCQSLAKICSCTNRKSANTAIRQKINQLDRWNCDLESPRPCSAKFLQNFKLAYLPAQYCAAAGITGNLAVLNKLVKPSDQQWQTDMNLRVESMPNQGYYKQPQSRTNNLANHRCIPSQITAICITIIPQRCILRQIRHICVSPAAQNHKSKIILRRFINNLAEQSNYSQLRRTDPTAVASESADLLGNHGMIKRNLTRTKPNQPRLIERAAIDRQH